MPLDHVPDLNLRAAEIDDPILLVHRLLYRIGRIERVFDDSEQTSPSERTHFLRAMNGHNRGDLRRLESLLADLGRAGRVDEPEADREPAVAHS